MEERQVPSQIERNEVKKLMDEGAQVVEVLPSGQYESEHLPGAINIPLKQIDEQADEQLDRSRPVIVYCADYL